MATRKPKRGRPAEFTDRRELKVLLEARELATLQRRAAREELSASAFVRKLIQRAVRREEG